MSEYQIRAIRDGQAFAVEGPGVRPIYMTEGEAMAWQRHLNAAFAAGAASRPAPDVDAIAREAAEAVMHEHTNPNLDTGVAAAIIREAIERATRSE